MRVEDAVDLLHGPHDVTEVRRVAHLEGEAQLATRSREVVTAAERMLTPLSEITRVTSDSSRERSSASTWICTRKTLPEVGAHSTSMIRSGCERRESALVQSLRCTETPLPRVTKPTMSSPGTGVQQRASLTQMSRHALDDHARVAVRGGGRAGR